MQRCRRPEPRDGRSFLCLLLVCESSAAWSDWKWRCLAREISDKKTSPVEPEQAQSHVLWKAAERCHQFLQCVHGDRLSLGWIQVVLERY